MEVLALADDLTGALEVGAKFAARVDAWPKRSCLPRHVIDTETRHLRPGEAAARIREVVAGSQARLIYHKTDSTLRGNIGAELGVLVSAYPESPLIYAPAYPRMGRIVKRGRLHIHGALAHETAFAGDALNPVSDSDIARVLRSQTRAAIFLVSVDELRNLKPGAIYVCDGESDADIAEAASVIVSNGYRLAAGPAALAESIARRVDLPQGPITPWPKIGSCLVINGSRHELSSRQVCHAVERGWRYAGDGEIRESEWMILEGVVPAKILRNNIRDILTRAKPDALAIFGGDTVYGVLQGIGNPGLYPLGEIVCGVPISKVDGRDLHLITKAGGFGSVDVLSAIREALL